mgnify:CR=1 FL=1
MKELAAKISSSELEVLEVLWRSQEPMPISAIRAALEDTHSWDASTVKTLLRRLREKGAVACEKRDVFCYWPLLSRQEYRRWSTLSFLQRVYQGSVRDLVTELVVCCPLSQEDRNALRGILYPQEGHG